MALSFEDPKDPNEVLDYEIDWTDRLDGDTIATSVFTLTTAAGLAINSQSHTTAISTVWLSGGTIPVDATSATAVILCRITTSGGRTMDQSAKLKIKDK